MTEQTDALEVLREENSALRLDNAALRRRIAELEQRVVRPSTAGPPAEPYNVYRALFDALPTSIALFRRDGFVADINPATEARIGVGGWVLGPAVSGPSLNLPKEQ